MENNKTQFKKDDIGRYKVILVVINNNLHKLFAWTGEIRFNFTVIINNNLHN